MSAQIIDLIGLCETRRLIGRIGGQIADCASKGEFREAVEGLKGLKAVKLPPVLSDLLGKERDRVAEQAADTILAAAKARVGWEGRQ